MPSLGKPWSWISVHYCGWDKDCRSVEGDFVMNDGSTLHVPTNRRINFGFRRHFWWFNITDWKDRGSHHRSPQEYKDLRQGKKR